MRKLLAVAEASASPRSLSEQLEADRDKLHQVQALIKTVQNSMNHPDVWPQQMTLDAAYDFLDAIAANLETVADRLAMIEEAANA